MLQVLTEPHAGPDPLIGVEIDGRFTITRHIGSGGTAAVYEARQHSVGRIVAVKLLHQEFAQDPLAAARFLREAQAASQLCHPAAITIHDFGISQTGQLYMVMEYLRGRSLAQELTRIGPMSPARVMDILTQVLEAVAEAHAAGIVHRDLKPDNIFLARDGLGREHVKVLDFGLACSHSTRITAKGVVSGTPEYLSPEVACGDDPGPAADLYALGVTAFELMSGRVPYQGSSPVATMTMHLHEPVPDVTAKTPSVPAAVGSVVQTLMAKMVGDRYEDADSAIVAIAESLQVEEQPSLKRPSAGAVFWFSGFCGALVGVAAWL